MDKQKTPDAGQGSEGVRNQTTKPIQPSYYIANCQLAGWSFSGPFPIARIRFTSGRVGQIPLDELLQHCRVVMAGLPPSHRDEVIETALMTYDLGVAA